MRPRKKSIRFRKYLTSQLLWRSYGWGLEHSWIDSVPLRISHHAVRTIADSCPHLFASVQFHSINYSDYAPRHRPSMIFPTTACGTLLNQSLAINVLQLSCKHAVIASGTNLGWCVVFLIVLLRLPATTCLSFSWCAILHKRANSLKRWLWGIKTKQTIHPTKEPVAMRFQYQEALKPKREGCSYMDWGAKNKVESNQSRASRYMFLVCVALILKPTVLTIVVTSPDNGHPGNDCGWFVLVLIVLLRDPATTYRSLLWCAIVKTR